MTNSSHIMARLLEPTHLDRFRGSWSQTKIPTNSLTGFYDSRSSAVQAQEPPSGVVKCKFMLIPCPTPEWGQETNTFPSLANHTPRFAVSISVSAASRNASSCNVAPFAIAPLMTPKRRPVREIHLHPIFVHR